MFTISELGEAGCSDACAKASIVASLPESITGELFRPSRGADRSSHRKSCRVLPSSRVNPTWCELSRQRHPNPAMVVVGSVPFIILLIVLSGEPIAVGEHTFKVRSYL